MGWEKIKMHGGQPLCEKEDHVCPVCRGWEDGICPDLYQDMFCCGAQVACSKEVEMDVRWEDMYACITPFTQDLGGRSVEFFKLGMYVWYDGGFYWTEQILVKEDIKLVEFDLVTWLLNEMVKMTDEYIDEGVKQRG